MAAISVFRDLRPIKEVQEQAPGVGAEVPDAGGKGHRTGSLSTRTTASSTPILKFRELLGYTEEEYLLHGFQRSS
ncbi:MAG: hypothetical protein MZV70_37115 [Desulfobacterales bacterium]|nr:hypothetical protein [Desulfobacterales bacterium]